MQALATTVFRTGDMEPVAHGPDFPPVQRRKLSDDIAELRGALGLTSNDVLVFDAMASFIPARDARKQEQPVTSDTLLVVFASNTEICRRCRGIDERTLRNAIGRLVRAGLVRRKDSATGKRFPIRQKGRIVDAYGIDLSPAFERAREINDRVSAAREEAERARNLRTEIYATRARILNGCATICSATREFLESLTKVLRRKLDVAEVRRLRDDVAAIAERAAAPCPAEACASASSPAFARGQTVLMADNRQEAGATARRPDDQIARGQIPEMADNRQDAEATVRRPGDSIARGQTRRRPLETPKFSAKNGQIDRQVESAQIEPEIPTSPAALWKTCRQISRFFPDPPRTPSEFRRLFYELGKLMTLTDQTMAAAVAHLGWERAIRAIDFMMANIDRIRWPDRYMRKVIADGSA